MSARRGASALLTILMASGLLHCADAYDSNSIFPEAWAESYTKVDTCFLSKSHQNMWSTTYVSPAALPTFKDETATQYPVGSIFLKMQYRDDACTELVEYTVVKKGEAGTAPTRGDWTMQLVGAAGNVVWTSTENAACTDCHAPARDWVWTTP